MSPLSIYELTMVIKKRYLEATKSGRTKILDEYCANTWLNRKYAISKIRNMCFKNKDPCSDWRWKKRIYSNEADSLLIKVWKAYDRICWERLHPYLREWLNKLIQFWYANPSDSTKKELLKRNIEIRLSSQWLENEAWYWEFDLIAHCWWSLKWDFIYTNQYVDIKTTWTERIAVMWKWQARVFASIKKIEELLPFPLKWIDSDNWAEFINHQLCKYCEKNWINFTRWRPWCSKDNAHIEQKNYSLVRKVLWYDRFDTDIHLRMINDLYSNELRLYLNFFQPSQKMLKKIRIWSKYKRDYDWAKTPYQRVLECPEISQVTKDKLKALYNTLDPIKLKKIIDKKVLNIIKLKSKNDL